VLDELCLTASFEDLDAHLSHLLSSPDLASLFEKLLESWEKTFRDDQHPDLVKRVLLGFLLFMSAISLPAPTPTFSLHDHYR
jgi:hypothetical protein